ncbi:LpqN/LpqT family lipoprotein [Mycobacterium leprae]|nr:LpqN/LpqT family lipoprotein [Mycobacterium leprae]
MTPSPHCSLISFLTTPPYTWIASHYRNPDPPRRSWFPHNRSASTLKAGNCSTKAPTSHRGIVLARTADLSDPLTIVALVSKLTSDVDQTKFLQYTPDELQNLPGYQDSGDRKRPGSALFKRGSYN